MPTIARSHAFASSLGRCLRITAPVIGAACLAIALSGCAAIPPPQQQSAEAGLLPSPVPAAPITRVPAGPHVALGVLLSPNVPENIAYLRAVQRQQGINPIASGIKEARESIAPEFFMQWIASSLSQRFGSVQLYDTLEDLRQAQPDVVATVDFLFIPSNEYSGTVDVTFYDGKLRRIGSATSKDSGYFSSWDTSITIASVTQLWHQFRVKLLTNFDRSLDALTRSQQPSGTLDACMRQVLQIADPALRREGIAACAG